MNKYTVSISDGTITVAAIIEATNQNQAAATFLAFNPARFASLDQTQDWTITIVHD